MNPSTQPDELRIDIVNASDRLGEALLQMNGLIALMAASENNPVLVEAYMIAPLMYPIRNLVNEAYGEITD